jgi:chromosome segregation ATPase
VEHLPTPASDQHDHHLADREHQLAEARAAFRRERDQLAADRAELDRLLAEAREKARDAARTRARTKRLAFRYARRVRQKWADVRADLETRQAAVEEAHGQLTAEVARFHGVRSDFYTHAAEMKDRLREGWESLEAQRSRMAAERGETNDYFAKQEAAFATREADLGSREKAVASAKAKLEKDTAALRTEAAGLEARIHHSRTAVEELERKRDQLQAELLASLPPPEVEPPGELRVALDRAADRDLATWAAELDALDQRLAQEKANLAAVKAALDRDAVAIADQRKVVAEQMVLLAAARAQWQDAERRTVTEMEELARGLRQREQEAEAREQLLLKADARRRADAYDLWQLRLRLEAWQSKLTLTERQWNAAREKFEAEYGRRVRVLVRREAEVEDTFGRWERARAAERERLRSELHQWADDRARMADAAAGYDRKAGEVLAELATHAARAMAAEDLLAEVVGEGKGTTRRFDVLRKRWDRVFAKKLAEIDGRRAVAAMDLARLDVRYQELHQALTEVAEREAEVNDRAAKLDAARLGEPGALVTGEPEHGAPAAGASSGELEALRAEVERMAVVLLDAGVPEAPDAPEAELPWAADEPDAEPAADVLPFAPHARAA